MATELDRTVRKVVEDYLGVGAGERFLIVADTATSPELAPAWTGLERSARTRRPS